MATLTEIQKIERHATRIRNGREKVSPGQPARFTAAASAGDAIWQGDLCLEIVEAVPSGYAAIEHPTDADRQLVPGSTQGARHCLDSLDGVTLYRPAAWPNVTQTGPALRFDQERTILHPTHGAVTIPAGFLVLCSYQREWDAEQKRERRNAD